MRRVYASTILIEGITLISQLILYKLAATNLGKDGFSEYALARRTITLLQPAVLLGLATAVPRYMALSLGKTSRPTPSNYFAAGLLVLALVLTATLTLLQILKGPFAFFFFGNADYRDLVPPAGLMLLGVALHVLCYSYLRGNLDMTKANSLHLLNYGILPLFVFALLGRSVPLLLTGIGASMGLTSAAALLFTRVQFSLCPRGAESVGDLVGAQGLAPLLQVSNLAKELLRYGIGRVPADFIQLAFLTLPATFMAHLEGIRLAGLVAFSTSILTMVASLFVPIGSVLLPEASRIIGQGDVQSLRARILHILKMAFLLLTLIVSTGEVFARPILKFYLGSSFADAVGLVRIVVLGALPYSLYVCLKSVVDAFSVKPINSRNMLISFALFLGSSTSVHFRLLSPVYVLIFLVIGLYVLGGLTLLEIAKIWRDSSDAPPKTIWSALKNALQEETCCNGGPRPPDC